MNLPEIGEAVRKARKAERLTQQQLAAEVRLNPSTISLIESGLTDIGVRKLERICMRLDLSIEVAPRKKPTWEEQQKAAVARYNAALLETDRLLEPHRETGKKHHA